MPRSRTAHSATMDEADATRPCHLFDRARKNDDEDISMLLDERKYLPLPVIRSFIVCLPSLHHHSSTRPRPSTRVSRIDMDIAAVLSEAISWCVTLIYWSPERKERSIDVEPTTKHDSGLRWRWPWRESEILELPSHTSRPTSACITPSPPIDR